MVVQTKLTLPCINITQFNSDKKSGEKAMISLHNGFSGPRNSRNVCPVVIPEIFAKTQGQIWIIDAIILRESLKARDS